MTDAAHIFDPRNDLSALISEQNTVHPLSNADLYGPEPHLQGITTRQHAMIVSLQMACTLGLIPLNDSTEDRDALRDR